MFVRIVSKEEFVDELSARGFSRVAAEKLYEHLQMKMQNDIVVFDPNKIALEWKEYSSATEAAGNKNWNEALQHLYKVANDVVVWDGGVLVKWE